MAILTGLGGGGIGPERARDQFLHGGALTGGVRSTILTSWERSRLLGLSPAQSELPFRQDFDPEGPLVRAAESVLDRLQAAFEGGQMNIALADAQGTVLQRRFGDPAMIRRLPPIQSAPGFVFSEEVAGTNGIGLALAERRLVRVYGAEHFAERSQRAACTAIPVRDPLSGRIEGILCLGYPPAYADPKLDIVIGGAAAAIERRLLRASSARERSLLQQYLDTRRQVAGGAAGERLVGIAELTADGLTSRDQAILEEQAAQLISCGQRTAVEVCLSGGRRVVLLSSPVTSPSGVKGIVIEAVLPGDWLPQRLDAPRDTPRPTDPVAALAASAAPPPEQRSGAGRPGAGAARGTKSSEVADIAAGLPPGAARQLLLLGEPEVGKHAVAARRRLELLSEASARIGTTLDVRRTAQELAEMAVPRLADYVTIDVPTAVLRGEESADPRTDLFRTVVHGIRDDCPFYPVGERVQLRPGTPQLQCLAGSEAILEPVLGRASGWLAQDREHADHLLAHQVHSLIAAPLLARGVVLGIVSFYRAQDPAPFGDDDRFLAQELATRAAVCIDNARRYTREHGMVLALQRSLLPHGMPEQGAVEVAHRYLPAESGVGGDWFDVVPLSGARVALVVGDVVGHGMRAAATMGQLRIAARNFAELDLAPDELLTQLDNLVMRLDREESGGDLNHGSPGIIGATCVYAVYDPTSQRCTLARAGHPPPALVRPDGTVSFPDLPAGPPLGLGGLPFETVEIDVPEGSRLVLYTDGLIEDRARDVDAMLEQLAAVLARPGLTSDETCQAVLDAMVPERPVDDIALLVARTKALAPDRIARWDLPADPAMVSAIRSAVSGRLGEWGLDDAVFTVELLLSELVTNAVRYGSAPIEVRLILPERQGGTGDSPECTLICEVADGSSTAPHLRHAASTDEGGRGLFLVAQLARAWGTRYTARGKVIWAECSLERPEAAPVLPGMAWEDIPALG